MFLFATANDANAVRYFHKFVKLSLNNVRTADKYAMNSIRPLHLSNQFLQFQL